MIATFFEHAHVLLQFVMKRAICNNCPLHFVINFSYHILYPRRASGSQSGREESFQSRAEESLGTDSQTDQFQTVKRMQAPDWAQKMLCIIVSNNSQACLNQSLKDVFTVRNSVKKKRLYH